MNKEEGRLSLDMDMSVGSMVGRGARVERDGERWSQYLNELRCMVTHKK